MPGVNDRRSSMPARRARAARARNDVVLCGRVAAPADERELPSGDTIVTARLIVDRDAAAHGPVVSSASTPSTAWPGLRASSAAMRGWEQGERVEIEGAIRRRFFRGATGPVSRVEVEIRKCPPTATASRQRRALSLVVESPHDEAHPGLRAERRRLARHHLAGPGDLHHLGDRGGMHAARPRRRPAGRCGRSGRRVWW